MSTPEKQQRGVLAKGVSGEQGEITGSLDAAAYGAFRAIFDSSREALVIIDRAGAIQMVNPRARTLLPLVARGLQATELAGLIDGFTVERLGSLSSGQEFVTSARFTDDFPHVDFPVSVTLLCVLPITQNLLVSIKEHSKDHNDPSEWFEAELRTILDSIQPGILVLDRTGRIRRSNPRFAELLGLHRRDLDRITSLRELSPLLASRLKNPAAFSGRWRAFADGHRGPAHDDFEILGPPVRLLERFSRTIFNSEGHNLGWVEIYSDVTEHRQNQLKILQTEKMATLGQVIAGIAHELNNPLTAILGNVQLLLGRGLDLSAATEARRVYQEAERARRIVKNLLYFARENKPERSPVDLNEIIQRTVALRSYELKNENIRVETDLSSGLPRTMADPYQLQQVVLNLLINAEQALLEARGQDTVKIRTTCFPAKGASYIRLEFSDNGPGIPSQIAPRIFDPFFTTKAPGVGTGLGLSIVYGIIQQHEGEVTFENQPNSGAKFIIELPALPPTSTAPGTKVNFEGKAQSKAVKLSRILVVEDEPTVAQLIADVLQEEGHRVNGVLDSRHGLDLISRRSYDLIICDLRMPRLDGPSFFRALQRARNPMQHRILFITGDTLAPSTLRFLETNHLPYLAKPFLVEELKAAVWQQLSTKKEKSRKAEKDSAGIHTSSKSPLRFSRK